MKKHTEQLGSAEAHRTAADMEKLTGPSGTGEDYDVAHQLTEQQSAEAQKHWQETFDRLFKDRLGQFPPGNFASSVPGLKSISILNGPTSAEGKVSQLFVIPFATIDGKGVHHTVTLNNRGVLTGVDAGWMRRQEITVRDLQDELVRIAETVDDGFFTEVPQEMLPPGFWPKGAPAANETKEAEEAVTDVRRIRLIREHPQILFGFVPANAGFRGYYGFVFTSCILMENIRVGNALYVIPLEQTVEISPEALSQPQALRIPETRRLELLRGLWNPHSDRSKWQLLTSGDAHRFIHPNLDDDEWEQKMRDALARIIT